MAQHVFVLAQGWNGRMCVVSSFCPISLGRYHNITYSFNKRDKRTHYNNAAKNAM